MTMQKRREGGCLDDKEGLGEELDVEGGLPLEGMGTFSAGLLEEGSAEASLFVGREQEESFPIYGFSLKYEAKSSAENESEG